MLNYSVAELRCNKSLNKSVFNRNSKTLSVEYKFVCGFEFLILKLSVTRYHSSTVVVFGFQKEYLSRGRCVRADC